MPLPTVFYLHALKERLDAMLAREGRENLAAACFRFFFRTERASTLRVSPPMDFSRIRDHDPELPPDVTRGWKPVFGKDHAQIVIRFNRITASALAPQFLRHWYRPVRVRNPAGNAGLARPSRQVTPPNGMGPGAILPGRSHIRRRQFPGAEPLKRSAVPNGGTGS